MSDAERATLAQWLSEIDGKLSAVVDRLSKVEEAHRNSNNWMKRMSEKLDKIEQRTSELESTFALHQKDAEIRAEYGRYSKNIVAGIIVGLSVAFFSAIGSFALSLWSFLQTR